MDWNYERAAARIDGLINERQAVLVEGLDDRLQFLRQKSPTAVLAARSAFISIPRDRAVLVHGVHVYARLSNYDDFRLDAGAETEASHKRAFAFLHLLYAAMDRVVQDFGAQRVDYHGSRLHCVVVDPVDNEAARILKAISLAHALQNLVRSAARDIGRFDFDPQLKVGIDSGKCVAINDGKGCEQEPLFLGQAANYAAKLADGYGQGIYLSNHVRSIVGLAPLAGLVEERSYPLRPPELISFRTRAQIDGFELPSDLRGDEDHAGRLINDWRKDILEKRDTTGSPEAFRFHAHTPPLRNIDYNDLSPANSIRMPLASIFSDLDGYTAYIDRCMAAGRAGEAVRALHVLRGEFHNVLRSDFESRKVRYIGDCIHGIMAFGTSASVDLPQTTREAIKCAAGLQGSFEIVQARLGGLNDLGLATGIEVGETPISRIGIRGDHSVRVASSTATIQSQCEQERISGSGMALGPVARSQLSLSAARHFQDGIMVQPDYDDVSAMVAGAAMLAGAHSASVHAAEEFRPHAKG
jgi:class 3 adenylate cyclase